MTVRRATTAALLAAGLALSTAACDASVEGTSPGQTETVPGGEDVGIGGETGDDSLGGTQTPAP